MNFSKYLLASSLVWMTVVPGVAVAEKNNLVAFSAMAAPYNGALYGFSYERMLSSGLAVGGRISSISYDCWDCSSGYSSYHEWGSGTLAEVTFTYHFFRDGFDGPFIGPAIGQAHMNWSWYDSTSFPSSGDGTTNAISYMAVFGWDFTVGPGITIRPLLTIGSWGGSATDSTGTKKSSLGTIAAAGASVGWAF